jgi:hypothetical protein
MAPTLRKIAVVILTLYSSNAVHADVARENKIKAAYLYHIINFVQWPGGHSNSRKHMSICLVGDATFQSLLKPLTNNSSSHYDVEIVVNHSNASVDGCHIVYFANTTVEQTKYLIAQTRNRPILTLGDVPGFARLGGMIGFVNHENNVRLEVNLSSANNAGLSISAKLLEVALNIIEDQSVDSQ